MTRVEHFFPLQASFSLPCRRSFTRPVVVACLIGTNLLGERVFLSYVSAVFVCTFITEESLTHHLPFPPSLGLHQGAKGTGNAQATRYAAQTDLALSGGYVVVRGHCVIVAVMVFHVR